TLHVLDTNVDQFVGIPYAEPPVGKHRFAKPEPISKPFPNIIDATKPKNSCLSPIQLSPDSPLSEDCLVLNIWTTNTTALKPVMFWIYGGGLAAGSIYQPEYNGSALATNDVVVVSVNYRLGPFGFLYGDREDAPGNVGFYDQLLGMKWVRENIHSFGGDRDQITIFGESSGSESVSAHILSPLSKGLFKRAIMESGANMYNKDRDVVNKTKALSQGKAIAKQLKCNETEDWIQCLRRADARDIIKYWDLFDTYPVFGTEFLPIRTQQAFNEKKFNTDVDLIAGITQNEGSSFIKAVIKDPAHMTLTDFNNGIKAFDLLGYHNINVTKVTDYYLKGVNTSSPAALLQSFSALAGDLPLGCPTYLFAKRFAQTVKESQRVYFYELLYKSEWFAKQNNCSATMGICHMSDIPFVFGLPLLDPHHYSHNDIYYSKVVMKMWSKFATYGNMDSDWPQLLNDEPMGAPKVHEYNGTALATNDVVVVSVNYRLGAFGFLYGDREDAPGNVGFYDQLLALKWVVSENIHSFGGDRDRITIFGQSAGSQSVSAHILSPLSKGLFKRAIMESGSVMVNKNREMVTKPEALSQAKAIAAQLKCNESEDWIQCLRRADAKDILRYWNPLATFPVFGTKFLPISARQAFKAKKFNTDVDLIAGNTRNEGTSLTRGLIKDPDHMTVADFYNGIKSFDALGYHNLNVTKVADDYLKGVNTSSPAALLQSFSAFAGDLGLVCPTYLFAKRFAQTVKESQRVYFYELLYASEWFANYSQCNISTMGICHGMEIAFVFGLPLLYPDVSTPEDIFYANVVMKLWSKFAACG
ncbi:unnamed protein product, partial [Medioppia subpectinata]